MYFFLFGNLIRNEQCRTKCNNHNLAKDKFTKNSQLEIITER